LEGVDQPLELVLEVLDRLADVTLAIDEVVNGNKVDIAAVAGVEEAA
jgi:hypothetical protein